MDLISSEPRRFPLSFTGKGGTYFGIVIVNWLLTIVTLGIYHPWAKARTLKYMYGSTVFNDDQFVFHGTGKEMFIGYLKTLLILLVLFAIAISFSLADMQVVGIVIAYLLFFAFIPLAIHGSYRYRMSRTTWRGIRFGYRGDKWVLFGNMLKWLFLSLITLGIYSAWMEVKMRKYIFSNVRAGSASFSYEADGGRLFWIIIKGYLLTIITLGIYMFWWQKELFEFYVNNMELHEGEKKITFKSEVTGGGIFGLSIVNLLLLVFTLGIGFAWVEMRTYRYFINNIKVEGDIDLDKLMQTEEDYTDATGDEMADFFDIDFIV